MFKKIAALATAAVLCAGLMAGCGASSTTADTSYSAENPLVLTLAHGLSEAHTVHIAMTQFAEEVNEKTGGRVQVKIFPNGQLGSENENLEQLQAIMKPANFVGRSVQQTEEFFAEHIDPILEKEKDALGMHADINV